MRGLDIFARALPVGVCSIVLCAVLLAHQGTAKAQCVGDCTDDGMVSISDLILGVNIALGLQEPSACPPFQNEEGQVTIAQLIKGVNNALIGCPPEPTSTSTATSPSSPTSTSTPESTATRTSTSTAESTATRTSTNTFTATPTGTAAATVTVTATPTGTAEATVTATETPAETATATATETPAETATATATETEGPTATDTPIPPPTSTATESPTPASTATETNTLPPSSTPTVSATPTASDTATQTPTVTPTATEFPIGDSVAGSAAIVSVGLSSVQSLIGAIVAQATNQGPPVALVAAPLDVGVDEVQVTDIDQCPVSGTTEQTCTEMGSLNSKTIALTLEANQCVAAGPAGGSAEFNGRVHVDADPFVFNDCDPLVFLSGSYQVGDPEAQGGPTPLEIIFRNDMMETTLDVTALLSGTVSISGTDPSCLIGALTVTLNGSLNSELGDGSGVGVEFNATQMVMDQITYNDDCVPLAYRLKFNGMATFTLNPLPPAVTTNGIIMQTETFPVVFTNFSITQDATDPPVIVTMMGSMDSYCFGGAVSLQTLFPIAVAAGQLCPNAGQLGITATGAMATVTYDDGMVTVDQAGMQQNYPSCLAPELLNCPQ